MILVTFYTKPDCGLCDDAEALLAICARRWPLKITAVNILRDDDAYAAFHDKIPVLEFADGTTLTAPIRRDQLTPVLSRLAPAP